MTQSCAFPVEAVALAKKPPEALKMKSKILPLDPFVDEKGILRVGGRLKRAAVSFEVKHPVLLPLVIMSEG